MLFAAIFLLPLAIFLTLRLFWIFTRQIVFVVFCIHSQKLAKLRTQIQCFFFTGICFCHRFLPWVIFYFYALDFLPAVF